MNNPVEVTTKRELTKEEAIELLNTFVDAGINLIRTNQFLEAQTYFHDPRVAEAVGLKFGENVTFHFFKEINAENLYDQIRIMYIRGTFHFGMAHQQTPGSYNTISISHIYTGEHLGNTVKRSALLSEAGLRFFHDVALINAEEWLHALQHLKGTPLIGEPNNELDVALYLQSKGVKLTRTWVDRYRIRAKGLDSSLLVD